MGTTLADLDATYGSPGAGTTYCYGLGGQGSHGDAGSGAGGASSLLRTCENVSQAAPTGVLLIGGGGGGGAALHTGNGGRGGVAVSTTAGACPASCEANSTSGGAGDQGGDLGGHGGAGGSGGAGADAGGNPGADGIGGAGGFADHWGQAGFFQGAPQVTGDAGSGGSNDGFGGGSGGGGYGGGGSGFDGNGKFGGGGGGGSYAAKSSLSFASAPGNQAADGWLAFVFNFSDGAIGDTPPSSDCPCFTDTTGEQALQCFSSQTISNENFWTVHFEDGFFSGDVGTFSGERNTFCSSSVLFCGAVESSATTPPTTSCQDINPLTPNQLAACNAIIQQVAKQQELPTCDQ
jgi:hypothetical protein